MIKTISTCLLLVATLGFVAGCSCGPDLGGLFDDSCNTCAPQPVAQAPCAPEPVCAPAPVCDPAPVQTAQRPPDAAPGEVWCYVRVPAQTRTETERVCVRQATCREVQVPAVTKQVERRVCTCPASTRRIPVPAQFEEQAEQICVAPGRTEWARVDCNPSQLAPQEQVGECWTLREVPPQYQTRTKRVCVRPESYREETIPAQYETRMETVVVEPARVDRIEVPAEYETRMKEVVVCGPRWEWRRTTECEVPAAAGGYAPEMAPAPAPSDLPAPAPAPYGSPDGNDLPPAGELPPLR
jgi:hypothetical protein